MNRVAFFARDLTELECSMLNELAASIKERKPELKDILLPLGFSLYYESKKKERKGSASSAVPAIKDPNGS